MGDKEAGFLAGRGSRRFASGVQGAGAENFLRPCRGARFFTRNPVADATG
jgi:hypothetical protein